jgi:hypothetical protein
MPTSRTLRAAAFAAAVGAGAVGGALLAAPVISSAQTTTTTTAPDTSSGSATPPPAGGHRGGGPAGPHTNADGKAEELLTGDLAARVTAAATAAYPDATVVRVETDVDGATYEAHMTKADGTPFTVLFDENVNVTGTEDGPAGHR